MGIKNGKMSSNSVVSYNLTSITVTSTTLLASGNSYIANSASQITFKLPAVMAPGMTFEVIGYGPGGWKIVTNENATAQSIVDGPSASVASNLSNVDIVVSRYRYDSIRLRAINSTVVSVEYKNGPTVISGLVLPAGVGSYYRMDEATTLTDLKNGRTLTRTGSPTQVAGLFNYAQSNMGPDNAVANYFISNSAAFGWAANAEVKMALDFFIKTPTLASSSYGVFNICSLGGVDSQAPSLGFQNSGGLMMLGTDQYANYYGYRYNRYNTNGLIGNNFYHVMATFYRPPSSGAWVTNIYINGALVTTENGTGMSINTTAAGMLTIGCSVPGGYHFSDTGLKSDIIIDDFAVWMGTIPTLTDAQARWNNGSPKMYVL